MLLQHSWWLLWSERESAIGVACWWLLVRVPFQWESASASMPVSIVGSLNPCNMQDSQAKSLKKISRSPFFQDHHPPQKLKLLKITSPEPGWRAGTLSQAGYVVGDSTCYMSAAAVIPVPLAYIKVDAVNSWWLHQLMPPTGKECRHSLPGSQC